MTNTTPSTPWGRPILDGNPTTPWGRPLTAEQQQSAAAATERAAREQKDLASIIESRVKLGDTLDQAERHAHEYANEQHRTHDDVLAALNVGWRAESLRQNARQAREATRPPIRTAAQVLDEHRRRTRPVNPTARRIAGS